jgi:CBS domain-containing protein
MPNSEFEDAYDDEPLVQNAILTTPISDLPLRAPIVVDATATAAAAVDAMNAHHIGCVLVQQGGRLVGIFTERDVLTRVVALADALSGPVSAVMTPAPETLEATETIAYALNKMSVDGYRHIPIVDRDGKAVSVLSVRDIVDYLVDLFPGDVHNLPPNQHMGYAESIDGG